ncbi:cyclin-J [Culicoides brevitarsis]|uniref:cyclin-J n=1 Tax=Culicoides brevitarsis TaxID=469753 RepID=UPI00307C70BE
MNFLDCAPCFSHPLFMGQYIEDIVESLYEKERTRIPFNFASPQISYRSILVDFMQNVSEHKQFRRATLHLGIYFLDLFMDNHSIELERLNIVSMVCLLLGAKIEEMEFNVPRVSEITRLTNIECTVADYISLEMMVLTFFEWNVMQPTAVTFLELYLDAVISQEDFERYTSQVTDGVLYANHKAMKTAATSMIFKFLDLTLTDVQLSVECPSQLAAAIVATTRFSMLLDPVWPPNIERITGYPMSVLDQFVSRLFRLQEEATGDDEEERDKRKDTPESGYMSCKEDTTDTEEEEEEEEIEAEDETMEESEKMDDEELERKRIKL